MKKLILAVSHQLPPFITTAPHHVAIFLTAEDLASIDEDCRICRDMGYREVVHDMPEAVWYRSEENLFDLDEETLKNALIECRLPVILPALHISEHTMYFTAQHPTINGIEGWFVSQSIELSALNMSFRPELRLVN